MALNWAAQHVQLYMCERVVCMLLPIGIAVKLWETALRRLSSVMVSASASLWADQILVGCNVVLLKHMCTRA